MLSAETAQKAVTRWNLAGGRVTVLVCSCRVWTWQGGMRRVFACRTHRQEFSDA
jgi:hypothetical protein